MPVALATPTAARLISFQEYLAFHGDPETQYELVDGELAPMAPPTLLHILIAKQIEQRLEAEIRRLGQPWLALREVGIRTALRRSRIADLCVVERALVDARLNDAAVFEEPPLLVVEVVSPESAVRDYRYKRTEYAAAEIGEYWVVDPQQRRLTLFLLDEGLYEGIEYQGPQRLASRLFPGLEWTADDLFDAVGSF